MAHVNLLQSFLSSAHSGKRLRVHRRCVFAHVGTAGGVGGPRPFVLGNQARLSLLVGRWFVFWGVGVRLFSAGISQTANPRFTAVTILGLKTSESWMVVRELGFGNLAIGAVALGSIAARTWITPSALAGAVFYGLAAINHIAKKNRNRLENFTLLSDVFACCVLCVYLLSVIQAR